MGTEGEGAYGGIVGELEGDAPYVLAGGSEGGGAIGIVDDARSIEVGEEALAELETGEDEVALHELAPHEAHEGELLTQVAVGKVTTHGIGVDQGDVFAQEVASVQGGEQSRAPAQRDNSREVTLACGEVGAFGAPVLDVVGCLKAVGIASRGEVDSIEHIALQRGIEGEVGFVVLGINITRTRAVTMLKTVHREIVVARSSAKIIARRKEVGEVEITSEEMIAKGIVALIVEVVYIGITVLGSNIHAGETRPCVGETNLGPRVDTEARGEVELRP